jgi:putative ABC transport system permease protein
MMLRHYTYRQFVRRPGRTLLTLGGIVIGVAGVFAIALTVNTTRHAYQRMFADLTGRAALEVVAEGGGGFDRSIAADIAAVSGVRSARPVVQMVAGLVNGDSPLGVMIIGTDPATDEESAAHLVSGAALSTDDEVLLVDNFARGLKLAVGNSVRLLAPRGVQSFRIAGLVEPTGVAGFNGGAVLFVSLSAAGQLFKLDGQVTAIPIELEDRANQDAVRQEVARLLPAGLSVRSPASRGELAQHSLFGAEQGLSALSAVSIVAGGFVILNSFLMSLGERRRQLAILRAIGVTSGQVTSLLVREAFILGIVGMVLGMGLGFVTSLALMRGMEQLLGVALQNLEITAEPFVLAALFGPGMAVFATLAPARRAARRPPLPDLLGLQVRGSEGMRGRMSRIGLLLGGASVLGITLFMGGWFPTAIQRTIPALLLATVLVSGVLLTPTFFPYLARTVSWLLRPLWGIEGRLAARQLAGNSLRSGLTAAVLCVALVISIAMGQSLRNNINDVEEWSVRTFTADYLVRGTLPELSYAMGTHLPEELHDELAQLEGVASVHELNLIQAKAGDEGVVVLARTFDAGAALALDIAEGDREDISRGLLAGEAVIGTALAKRLNLTVGDQLPLRTRKGEQKVRIAGTVTEYIAGGMAAYLDRGSAKSLFKLPGVDVFMVTAQDGMIGPLGKRMEEFCESRGLMLQSNAEFRARIHHMMAGVIGFLWLLMALVFVVASLGIVNTLTMNVLEQTREIALLRAVALCRRQIRKMVFFQALALGLCSLVPGIGLGLVLAYLMNLSTHVLLGQPVDFHADGWFVAACGAACLIIASGASWIPARRASRLQIVRALQYE